MLQNWKKTFLLLLGMGFFISSCCYISCYPSTPEYRQMYAHLDKDLHHIRWMRESDYYLIVLVEAHHLDYTDNTSFFRTIAKHPDDGSKNGEVGHAWIYLYGIVNGRRVVIEGGHSGELGVVQPKYFDGVMNYIDYGYADPTEEEKAAPRHEPNPIKYLWVSLRDGFFQKGAGGHIPTFAAKVDLTKEQFFQILSFIHPSNYCYQDYAVTGNQCSSFVAQVAAIAGFSVEHGMRMKISPVVTFRGRRLPLWTDFSYSEITFSTPDVIECSLIKAVEEGRAEYALDWYLQVRSMKASKK